jgi:hypothetical protein
MNDFCFQYIPINVTYRDIIEPRATNLSQQSNKWHAETGSRCVY